MKSAKKLLSSLLCVAMILSMLPAVLAAEPTVSVTLGSSTQGTDWEFVGSNATYEISDNYIVLKNSSGSGHLTGYEYVAVKLSGIPAGTYSATVGMTAASYGCGTMYLFGADKLVTDGNLQFNGNGTWLGTATTPAVGEFTETVMEKALVEVGESGDYYFSFYGPSGSGYHIIPCTISLSPVMSLDKDVVEAEVGDEITVTATVAKNDAITGELTWKSSNSDVATVANGVIKAVGAGKATITAAVGDFSATCSVTVKGDYNAGSVEPVSVALGSSTQGTDWELVGSNATYEISDYIILKNSSGSGHLTGYEYVAVKLSDIPAGTYSATVGMTLGSYGAGVMHVFGADKLIEGNGDLQFNGNGTFLGTATKETAGGLTETVMEKALVEVSESGDYYFSFYGPSYAGYHVMPCTISLSPVMSLDKDVVEAEVGDEITVTATVAKNDAITGELTWKSSNSDVATVANGVIKAVGAGKATITAAVGGFYVTCDVTVTDKPSAVIGDAEEGSPFGTKYAYIKENIDGTYDITLIGGIDKLVGYSAVGFEIVVDGDAAKAEYSQSENVYTSLDVSGSKYTAEDDYDAKYIFTGSRSDIAAGSTVVARPYVVVNGEKQFLANAELTLKL